MTFHKAIKIDSERVNQGDVFENISFIENYIESNGKFELNILDFPFIYILTQDCDLEQNLSERKKQQTVIETPKFDKYLISVLVAPYERS